MPSLSSTPPRIGWALSLSAAVSAVILVLRWRDVSDAQWSWIEIASLFTLVFNVYYLVRYFQGHSAIKQGVSSGGSAWPVAQLFPSRPEHVNYPTLAVMALLFQAGTIGSTTSVANGTLSLLDVPVIAVARWIQLFASVVVTIQAVYVRHAEDKVTCGMQGHDMRCERCRTQMDGLEKQSRPPSQHSIRPLPMLLLSTILSIIMVYTMNELVTPIEPRAFMAGAAVPIMVIFHRAYFILRLSARRQCLGTASWPFSPMIMGAKEKSIYWLGNMCAMEFYIITALFALYAPLGALWRRGPMERIAGICAISLLIVETAIFISGNLMVNIENEATCHMKGHQWKCIRQCKEDSEEKTKRLEIGSDTFIKVRSYCLLPRVGANHISQLTIKY
jgi:hypothetical protein